MLQKEVEDRRAGEETLEAPRYDEDGVNRPEMSIGTCAGVAKVATLEAQMTSLQKMVDDLRAGDKQTLEALKQGAGDYELQKRVDEMRELKTMVDDM